MKYFILQLDILMSDHTGQHTHVEIKNKICPIDNLQTHTLCLDFGSRLATSVTLGRPKDFHWLVHTLLNLHGQGPDLPSPVHWLEYRHHQ